MSGKHKYSDTINREGVTVVNTTGPLINSMAGSRSPNSSASGFLSTKWFGVDS